MLPQSSTSSTVKREPVTLSLLEAHRANLIISAFCRPRTCASRFCGNGNKKRKGETTSIQKLYPPVLRNPPTTVASVGEGVPLECSVFEFHRAYTRPAVWYFQFASLTHSPDRKRIAARVPSCTGVCVVTRKMCRKMSKTSRRDYKQHRTTSLSLSLAKCV